MRKKVDTAYRDGTINDSRLLDMAVETGQSSKFLNEQGETEAANDTNKVLRVREHSADKVVEMGAASRKSAEEKTKKKAGDAEDDEERKRVEDAESFMETMLN